MGSVFNILSIDWDYFIEADGSFRACHFPDIPNEKYPKSLQHVIWVNRYACDPELAKVGYKPIATKFVQLIKSVPFVVVAESHKYAYTYVVQKMRECHAKRVNLLNIDFHSDFRSDADELDCGNWLSVLMSEYKGNYEWLGWKDSYLNDIPKWLKFFTNEQKALSEIANTPWDMVFICRSDMWSPPHLDDAFTNIFKPFVDHFRSDVQQGIWSSRYDDKFQKEMLNMRCAMQEFRKGQ